MRCRSALAILLFGAGLPICARLHAQRGGAARGGFAARPAPSFSAAGSRSFGSGLGQPAYAPRFGAPGGGWIRPPAGYGAARYPGGRPFYAARPGYPQHNGSYGPGSSYAGRIGEGPRRPVYPRNGYGGYGGVGYVLPYPFLTPFFDGYGESLYDGSEDPSLNPFAAYASQPSWADPDPAGQQPAPYAGDNAPPYAAQPSPYGQEAAAPYPPQPVYQDYGPYAGGPATAPQPMVSAPFTPLVPLGSPTEQGDVLTIVFKDGRPPLQVRNYILTRSALYLTGAHFYEVPLADIDLPATQRVNWDAGVVFRLP